MIVALIFRLIINSSEDFLVIYKYVASIFRNKLLEKAFKILKNIELENIVFIFVSIYF